MPELGIYSIEEVAELLKMPISGVRDLIRKGELKACKFSERRTRIDEYDLVEFIKRSKEYGRAQKDGPKLEMPCDCL